MVLFPSKGYKVVTYYSHLFDYVYVGGKTLPLNLKATETHSNAWSLDWLAWFWVYGSEDGTLGLTHATTEEYQRAS